MRSSRLGNMTARSVMFGVLASLAIVSMVDFSHAQEQTDTAITGFDMPIASLVDFSEHPVAETDDKIITGFPFIIPRAFAETTCSITEDTNRRVVDIDLVGKSLTLPLMNGGKFHAMTFNEQIPGPVVRATQGDIIRVSLSVPEKEVTHSVDFHTSQMSASNFKAVRAGESHEFCFIAEVPGVFKYHCAGAELIDMDQHVLSGMYGITIIDPLHGYKKLMTEKTVEDENGKIKLQRTFYDPDEFLELNIVVGQLYLDEAGYYDSAAMMAHQETANVINGMQFGYVPNVIHNIIINGDAEDNVVEHPALQPWNEMELKQHQSQPVYLPVGTPVRIFIQNVGNDDQSFHIVGEILERVTQGGRIQSGPIETWSVAGSQNMIVDVVFDEPGTYMGVFHNYASIYSGAAMLFVVGDPFDLNPTLLEKGAIDKPLSSYAEIFGNPSSVIPPMGTQSIPHPAQNIHGLMADSVAEAMKASGKYIALWEEAPKLLEKLSLPLP